MRLILVITNLAVIFFLSGCAAEPQTSDDRNARNREYFLTMADQAEVAGASDSQVATLREAARTGTLSGAQVEPLLEPYFQCLYDGFGAKGEIIGTQEIAPGYVIPWYEIWVAPDTPTEDELARFNAVDEACDREHLGFAWKALQLQPAVQEIWEQDFARRTPAIMDCLAANGERVPSDSTANELIDAATRVWERSGVECLEAG